MFLKKVNLLIPILILVSLSSCNKDYYSVGIELYDNQFSDLKSKIFPVFSYQESLDKVQTNNLSSLHLGRYNDNFFGQINSSFISQLDISSIGDFGDFSQEQENEGSLTDIRVMVEDEQITSVYLDLPFYNNTNDSDKIHTILHEMGHMFAHTEEELPRDKVYRPLVETEAETIAYVLADFLNIDTSCYSIGYIANWSKGNEDILQESVSRITKFANVIMNKIDEQGGIC